MTQTKKDEDPGGATDVKGSSVRPQADNGFLGRTGPCTCILVDRNEWHSASRFMDPSSPPHSHRSLPLTSASRIRIPASWATALPAALMARAAAGEPKSTPVCTTPSASTRCNGGAVVLNTMVDCIVRSKDIVKWGARGGQDAC